MTGYNKVNGVYAGANRVLIEEILKGAWGYPGWVMSDWGATPTWDYALAGLDQESGAQIDVMMWDAESFTEPLRTAFAEGELPKERLSEMVRRILRSMYAVGIDRVGGRAPGARGRRRRRTTQIALDGARQGIVLLENDGILPLAADTTARIAVVGGYADSACPSAPARARSRRRAATRPRSTSAAPGSWAACATCTCCRRRRCRSSAG